MLNLSSRNPGLDSYAQSATNLYPRKNRFLASTGFNNPHSSMHAKLPQLSRSFSVSSSSKSTKLKLTTIEATLSSMDQSLQ